MAKNFEDMHWQEWPDELIELHEAAQLAWKAYAALEDILDVRVKTSQRVMDTTRSNLVELTGRAYALLRDLRAEGMRQLAAWEESQMEQQLVKLAENEIEWATEDDPAPEWEIIATEEGLKTKGINHPREN